MCGLVGIVHIKKQKQEYDCWLLYYLQHITKSAKISTFLRIKAFSFQDVVQSMRIDPSWRYIAL